MVFWEKKLKQTHGISDDFADFLNYAQTEFPNEIREGMTQALTNKILPEGKKTGQRFYPDETDIFESLVKGQGFDLEEDELFDEVKPRLKTIIVSTTPRYMISRFEDGFTMIRKCWRFRL